MKMKVTIESRNFEVTDALRGFIRRRVQSAFQNRDEHIIAIGVKLDDINGPKGGADKRCLVHLVLPHLSDVVVEDTDVDLYVAISRAMSRAQRALGRRVSRHRHKLLRHASAGTDRYSAFN